MGVRRLLAAVLLAPLVAGCSSTHAAPSDASNLARARAVAGRLMTELRMPPGAERLTHSPDVRLRRATSDVGPLDPALRRTTWWTVPLAASAFESWLNRVHEPGLTARGSGAAGVAEFSAAGTSAYTAPWLVVQYVATSRGVDVRADVDLSARFARADDSQAHGVTRLDIARVAAVVITPPAPQEPALATVHVTDASFVAEVVRSFDRLPGASVVPIAAMCPGPVPPAYDDVITFHTPRGDLVAKLHPYCTGSLTVWRGGHQLGHPLDPGDLGNVVARVYDSVALAPSRVIGTWHAVGVTGVGGRTLTPPGHPFVTFGSDGTVRGSDGVNDFSGRASVSTGRLRLSDMASSQVGLAGSAPRAARATVHAFAGLLTGAPVSVEITGDTMTLLLGRATLTLRKG